MIEIELKNGEKIIGEKLYINVYGDSAFYDVYDRRGNWPYESRNNAKNDEVKIIKINGMIFERK